MKALKTTVSITDLQKIIRMWRSRNITDSNIPKLLELYLGQTAYMNAEGEYPIENFYDLCQSLRFRHTSTMLNSIKQCNSFCIRPAENTYTLSAFYSPLWKKPVQTDTLAGTLPGKCPTDTIIYNTISKESSSSEEVLTIAKEFFHLINQDAVQKAQIFTPLIDQFEKEEGLSRKHACENLIILVDELLIPYFVAQSKFSASNHAGRTAWLKNLLKSSHGKHLINQAAKSGREKREQARIDNQTNQRSNHPFSPFEWVDLESGMRFYDDNIEGMVNIPMDALPRPSAEAVWNVLSQTWI